jgi:hypothetical protein
MVVNDYPAIHTKRYDRKLLILYAEVHGNQNPPGGALSPHTGFEDRKCIIILGGDP